MPTNHDIVAEARSWLNTPWRHQGRCKGVGVDCLGLIAMVGEQFGLVNYPKADYSRLPQGHRLMEECRLHLDEVIGDPRQILRPGDIAVITFRRYPCHIGMIGDQGYPLSFIHAFVDVGRVIEHNLDDIWVRRISSVFRYKGM